MSDPGKAWLLGVDVGESEPCEDPTGWPEFSVTLRFYVSSEDPEIIKRERHRIADLDWSEVEALAPATDDTQERGDE